MIIHWTYESDIGNLSSLFTVFLTNNLPFFQTFNSGKWFTVCVFTLNSQTTSWIYQTNILTGQNRLIYQSRHQSCQLFQHFVTHFLLDPTAFPIFDRSNKIGPFLVQEHSTRTLLPAGLSDGASGVGWTMLVGWFAVVSYWFQ